MLGPRSFCFLNVRGELTQAADWAPEGDRLWSYNLHYFDDLNSVAAANRRTWHEALIRQWISENRPGEGPGWEPYCLSLRIANWCRYSWSGGILDPHAVQSLAVQARALQRQLEFHILGNHLWANAKALIMAGLFFEGAEAEGWLETGERVLTAQLAEQILADGGHFERSPMYHHILAEDLLELIEAGRLFPGSLSAELEERLRCCGETMLAWARDMSPPDGELAFFNDSAMGIAPSLLVLQRHGRRLGIGHDPKAPHLKHLPQSGYVRAQGPDAVLLVDVGEIGPDYLPAHAHADTLSCEFSLHGVRVLVNTGISTYTAGARRLFERGSAAHNTVVVDSQNSSEVWSSFRVARRARPFGVEAVSDGGGQVIRGSHDGYRRLRGRVIHHRTWRLSERALVVEDRLDGRPRTAEAFWRLHPSVTARQLRDGSVECRCGQRRFRIVAQGGSISLEPGYWARGLGRTEPTSTLRVAFDGAQLVTQIDW